jgi:putative flippase GtrA
MGILQTGLQFVKFTLVGVYCTSIAYGVFLILYLEIGLPFGVAAGIGAGVGFVNNYLLNKHWTFQVRRSERLMVAKFALVNGLALGLNIGSVHVCTGYLPISSALGEIAAIGVSACVNFFGNKLWTFHRPRGENP